MLLTKVKMMTIKKNVCEKVLSAWAKKSIKSRYIEPGRMISKEQVTADFHFKKIKYLLT